MFTVGFNGEDDLSTAHSKDLVLAHGNLNMDAEKAECKYDSYDNYGSKSFIQS